MTDPHMHQGARDNSARCSRRAAARASVRSRFVAPSLHCSVTSAARAFTLIEIVVVIVIIGVLATAIVPRMLNVGQRQAEQEARSVQRLLTIAAEKASVWNQPVAIDYQQERGMLSVWVQKEDARATSETSGSARVRWVLDNLVEPAVLDRLRVSAASQDAQTLGSTKWRVAFAPGQARSAISITLEPKSDRDGPRWTISLPAGEATARRTAGGDAARANGGFAQSARVVDLDDSGKADARW